jgi:hypothetical protein
MCRWRQAAEASEDQHAADGNLTGVSLASSSRGVMPNNSWQCGMPTAGLPCCIAGMKPAADHATAHVRRPQWMEAVHAQILEASDLVFETLHEH